MIRPIDGKSVHRICSGQVVLTLGVAIKELVENSLDAGATHIDIKLKGYGTTLVQVSDNGSGIAEADYEGLTLKHHTSKIRVFDDLPSVETFGFRGEALSSLCAVSDLSIHTKDSVTSVGTKLDYDGDGRIKRRQTLPRGHQGTTVSISNLFVPLPVRRKEFERNAKREMGRAINFVTAYCLIHPDVRFSFTHQDSRSVSNLLSTDGRGTSPADCFASVFGPRLLQQVLKIEMVEELPETIAEEFRVKTLDQDHRICGWISSPAHGLGRSSPDRQFIFINKRPCEVQRVTRLINEIYRELNRHQYPFLLLDIIMSRDEVDVNVTPDKRSIFFDKESHLLALIKASVVQTLKGMTPIVPTITKAPVPESCGEESIFAILKRKVEESKKASGAKQQRLSFSHAAPKPLPLSFLPQCKIKANPIAPCGDYSTVADADSVATTKRTQDSDIGNEVEMNNPSPTTSTDKRVDEEESMELSESAVDKATLETDTLPGDLEMKNPEGDKENSRIENSQTSRDMEENVQSMMEDGSTSSGLSQTTGTSQNVEIESDALLMGVMDDDEAVPGRNELHKADENAVRRRFEADVNFSLENLRLRLAGCPEMGAHQEHEGRKFLAKIDPGENGQAEDELRRHLQKSDFVRMKVIGQFNLGFIVAELDGDLFIVDQHATDEKFNFERLQREHVMEYQRLIRPQTLELSVPQEMVVLDNLEVFEKNGFRFKINEEAPAGRKIDLISTPVSRNWDFGVSDIEEMIFVLEETQTTNCRPSKVRRMLASRACRSSIMIGTALNAGEMKKLLDHMAEMDVPWSCPHGRPTIRHLGNLSLLRLATEGT